MRFNYKTILDQDGKLYEHKFIDHSEPCCERMSKMLENSAVVFGEMEYGLNYNPCPCIPVCRPYPEGACWDHFEIDLCPACGEPIESVCVGTFKQVWHEKRRTVREQECTLERVKHG
jgi:hypothetical protein